MQNEKKASSLIHRYLVEEIFENYQEYAHYLVKALATFQDMKRSRNPSMRAIVPEYLEIDFANIKSPRLFFPRYKGTIVVQLPEGNLSPKQRGVVRARKLIEFSPLIKINEVSVGEQFAMRMKLLSPDKRTRSFKTKSVKRTASSEAQ